MELKQKILKHLIENNTCKFSIMQIASALKADYKNTYMAMDKIKDSIRTKKIGNSNFISFNFRLTDNVYVIEQSRTQEIIKNRDIKLVYDEFKKIDSPFFIALLFGSYAKKTDTKHSDIDICIIHDNKSLLDKILSRLSLFSFNIEVHDFTLKEFNSLLETRKPNIGHEIMRYSIILHGIENYYGLIRYE